MSATSQPEHQPTGLRTHLRLLRASAPGVTDLVTTDTNDVCHNYTGLGVAAHDSRIIRHVRLVIVLWGNYYVAHPEIETSVRALASDIVTGPYFNGLAQYGVSKGSLANSVVVNGDMQHPTPVHEDDAALAQQLRAWLHAGTVTPIPAKDEESLLYVILPDPTTLLRYGGFDATDPHNGFGGYHLHTRFNANSANDDVFFLTISTFGAGNTGDSFAGSISSILSHEINESVTDRDSAGVFDDHTGCEIGDICEAKADFSLSDKWSVQQYWSNWDRSCIRGSAPVSLRAFLRHHPAQHQGSLRSLATPRVSIDYIASCFGLGEVIGQL